MARPLTSQTWLGKYATCYHARTLCGLILMKANLALSHTEQLRWIEFDINMCYEIGTYFLSIFGSYPEGEENPQGIHSD